MITQLKKDEVIAMGARQRADYLVEQAGYTLGLAALDANVLDAVLPKGYVGEVTTVCDQVKAARQDKAMVAAEAKDASHEQQGAFAQAKVLRRTIARRASMAKRMGISIPEALTHMTSIKSAPALVAQLSEMIKLLEVNQSAIPGTGVDQIIKEGKALCDVLSSTDAKQEIKRLKELPEAVQKFYEQKGLLYTGLKVINDAGHAIHAADPNAAAKYNLAILHRHTGKHEQKPVPAPAAGAGAKA